jgi:hypothetical protein
VGVELAQPAYIGGGLAKTNTTTTLGQLRHRLTLG